MLITWQCQCVDTTILTVHLCIAGRGAVRGLIKPEILAPAGGWPQLRAAVENGADCVYFGVTSFNARARWGAKRWFDMLSAGRRLHKSLRAVHTSPEAFLSAWLIHYKRKLSSMSPSSVLCPYCFIHRASNFEVEELDKVMGYLRERNVKGVHMTTEVQTNRCAPQKETAWVQN